MLSLFSDRLSRFCLRRPWIVIGLWIVLLIISVGLRVALFEDGVTTEFKSVNQPESERGAQFLEDRLRGPTGSNEIIIVLSDSHTIRDPEFRDAVESVYVELAGLVPHVIREGSLSSTFHSGGEHLVSEDERITILPFTMAGDLDDASENISQVVEVVEAAKVGAPPGFSILAGGQAIASEEFRAVGQEGLLRGEIFGVPIALLILVLVFGAVIAALIPVILAAAAIIVAMGAASLLGMVFGLSFFVENVITMIGLAVGIDYTLFYISRFREERTRGLDKLDAVSRTATTAGRTVVFSGMAVMLGLAGMLLVPSNVFISIGLGAIFVVAAAVLGALTLLPAILGLLGDKINALSIPIIGHAHAMYDESGAGGVWDKVSGAVMRRPVVSLLLAGGLLIAALIPFFSIETGSSGYAASPDSIGSKRAFIILDEHFSAGEVTPVEIVIDGNISSEGVQGAISDLLARLSLDDDFSNPRPLEVNSAGDLALLTVPVAGDSVSKASQNAVNRLRNTHVPASFDEVPAEVLVTGATALNIDFFRTARRATFVVFPFVLGISFFLLLLVFRSIVVPIKAIILNLLSAGATYGVLVMVFQKGWGSGALGFQQVDTIEAWIPIFLFAVLFGLSMDYHVFLLSRVRERFDLTHDNASSVAFGIRSTGRLITGAALIMVAVFWGFAAGDLVPLQQMGFGLGLAVLLDATIVRIVLVPASMKLLGNWNWYMFSWLGWLPDLRVKPEPAATAPSVAD